MSSHLNPSHPILSHLISSYLKGAKEYSEKKVLDNRNRTMKRCFRLPSTVIHKLARYDVSYSIYISTFNPCPFTHLIWKISNF